MRARRIKQDSGRERLNERGFLAVQDRMCLGDDLPGIHVLRQKVALRKKSD